MGLWILWGIASEIWQFWILHINSYFLFLYTFLLKSSFDISDIRDCWEKKKKEIPGRPYMGSEWEEALHKLNCSGWVRRAFQLHQVSKITMTSPPSGSPPLTHSPYRALLEFSFFFFLSILWCLICQKEDLRRKVYKNRK